MLISQRLRWSQEDSKWLGKGGEGRKVDCCLGLCLHLTSCCPAAWGGPRRSAVCTSGGGGVLGEKMPTAASHGGDVVVWRPRTGLQGNTSLTACVSLVSFWFCFCMRWQQQKRGQLESRGRSMENGDWGPELRQQRGVYRVNSLTCPASLLVLRRRDVKFTERFRRVSLENAVFW